MRYRYLLPFLILPAPVFAQQPQIPQSIPVDSNDLMQAIDHLTNGGSYTGGKLIAARLQGEANAYVTAQQQPPHVPPAAAPTPPAASEPPKTP
jgi:hypothetical protein